MANHCIEVTCNGCGAAYCALGCSYDLGPNPLLIHFEPEPEQEPEYLKQPCKYCGEFKLIID